MEIAIGIIVVIVIYLLATGKKRRERLILGTINQMVLRKQREAVIPIYPDAAIKFALEHGGEDTSFENQWLVASCQMKIKEKNYIINFSRDKQGTSIEVTDLQEAMDKFKKDYGF